MKKTIEIKKVIIFDDKSVTNASHYIVEIKKIMERSLPKAKTLNMFTVAADLVVEFCSLDELNTKCISFTLAGEKDMDWYNHLSEMFDDEKIGYLVLCDYGWRKGKFEDANIKVFEQIKQRRNVVFACYTTIYKSAGEWLESILNEKHECKIIDITCTMPKDLSGKIRSLEEAILDEW